MRNRGSSILLTALIVFQFTLAPTAMNVNVDFVFIIHDFAQAFQNELTHIRDRMRLEFPTVFDMGENKTRVAVLATKNGDVNPKPNIKCNKTGDWYFVTPLTGNPAALDQSIQTIQATCGKRHVDGALELVHENVFGGVPTRPRVIFIITVPFSKHLGLEEDTHKEKQERIASEMRSAGVLFFGFFHYEGGDEAANAYKDFVRLIGNETNIYKLEASDTVKIQHTFGTPYLQNLKGNMTTQLCEHKRTCAFDESGLCWKTWYTELINLQMTYAGAKCDTPKEPEEAMCPIKNCDKECDHFWSKEKDLDLIDCNSKNNCAKSFEARRPGPMRWTFLENCTKSRTCGPCPKLPLRVLDRPQEPSDYLVAVVVVIIFVIMLLAAAAFAYLFCGDQIRAKLKKRKKKEKEQKDTKKRSKSKTRKQSKKSVKKPSSKKKPSSDKKKNPDEEVEEEESGKENGADGEPEVEKSASDKKVGCKIPRKKGKTAKKEEMASVTVY